MKNLSITNNMHLVVVECSVDTGEYFRHHSRFNTAAFSEKRPMKKFKASLETALKVLKGRHLKNPETPIQEIYEFAKRSFGIEDQRLISDCISKGSEFKITVEEIPVMESSKKKATA